MRIRFARGTPRTRGSGTARASSVIDEVVVTYFPAPNSYTGEHVVEISAHGSPVVLRAIVASAIAAGARLAAPGEFTLRAFLNGKRDLVQAEAVADLIEAATPLQARVAFDQLEGTLTEPHRRGRRATLRSDCAAGSVSRFPRRGLSLHRARRHRPTRGMRRRAIGPTARRRPARPVDSRRRFCGCRRKAQRRQVEHLQRACRRRSRDRHRDCRHDARSCLRTGGRGRPGGDVRGYGGVQGRSRHRRTRGRRTSDACTRRRRPPRGGPRPQRTGHIRR